MKGNYQVITRNGDLLLCDGDTTLSRIQSERGVTVDIIATLSNYYNPIVIKYWDIEIINDRVLWDKLLKHLFDDYPLYDYFRLNKTNLYSANRNGKYPL